MTVIWGGAFIRCFATLFHNTKLNREKRVQFMDKLSFIHRCCFHLFYLLHWNFKEMAGVKLIIIQNLNIMICLLVQCTIYRWRFFQHSWNLSCFPIPYWDSNFSLCICKFLLSLYLGEHNANKPSEIKIGQLILISNIIYKTWIVTIITIMLIFINFRFS